MTAATGSTTAAKAGCGPSESAPEATQIRNAITDLETPARPVPTVPAASPATLTEAGRNVVPAARPESQIRRAATDFATTSRTAGCDPSPQVAPVAPAGGRPVSASVAPGSATPVEDGPECAALAYVEALDGSERAVLLRHIAQAWPEVVAAGAELVEQWRAECAESRRANGKRRRREQRRRQRNRAAAGA